MLTPNGHAKHHVTGVVDGVQQGRVGDLGSPLESVLTSYETPNADAARASSVSSAVPSAWASGMKLVT